MANLRTARESGLDLAEFDAVTAHLDLIIPTAGILQHPVRTPPHHIPRPIQPPPRHERIRHKPLRG
ncbi:hypothetical protein, partial [Streptomyces sp. NL15-2K]|uniref:hypothetical protein n=1 Tax=Streptomyces sp. NL15-2K TaxID=376149 RepID=UPI00209BBBC1